MLQPLATERLKLLAEGEAEFTVKLNVLPDEGFTLQDPICTPVMVMVLLPAFGRFAVVNVPLPPEKTTAVVVPEIVLLPVMLYVILYVPSTKAALTIVTVEPKPEQILLACVILKLDDDRLIVFAIEATTGCLLDEHPEIVVPT